MNDADANDRSPSRLQAALLDYFSAPGKYQLSLREPALLFASIREILQLAAGRNAAGEDARVREAAVFFVRAALLYPGADHYALLGFPLRSEPADVKERYRLLMRLIHPDFAVAGSAAWPADAAVRVNRAYEVLASPLLRREYDEQLSANTRPQRPSVATAAGPTRTTAVRAQAPARQSREDAARVRKNVGIAVAAGAGLIAILLLLPHAEPDQLVQKMPVVRAPEVRVALAATPPPEAPAQPAALVASDSLSSPTLQQESVAMHPEPTPPSAAVESLVAAAPVHPTVKPHAPATVQPVQPARRPAAIVNATRAAAAAAPAAPSASHSLPAHIAQALAALSLHSEPPAPAPLPVAVAVAPVHVPPAMPEPIALASPAPAPVAPLAPAPAPAPASAALAAARPAVVIATASLAQAPTLADAQPLLTQLLQMLETGKGDELLRLLDAKARQAPSARSLSHDYEQIVQGARPVHLSQVEFHGEAHDGVLLVTGRMRVHAGEPTIGSYGQKFLVRAEFVSRGGKTMLTGLSGAPD